MFKLVLRFCVCISIICYSAIINEFDGTNVQKHIENNFNHDLLRLKQDYFGKIRELKENSTNCTNNGLFFNITAKIESLNRLFRVRAEQLKDLHEESVDVLHTQRYVRCVDCLFDYFDEMFSDFCDEMDEAANNSTILHSSSPNTSALTSNITISTDIPPAGAANATTAKTG